MKVIVGLADADPMHFTDVTNVDVNSASDLKLYKGEIDDRQLWAFFPNGSYRYFPREEDDTA